MTAPNMLESSLRNVLVYMAGGSEILRNRRYAPLLNVVHGSTPLSVYNP
jgi:hypothetical protein